MKLAYAFALAFDLTVGVNVKAGGKSAMTIGFNAQEGGFLYSILSDLGGDIIVKIDPDGFIEHASDGLGSAGISLADMLIAPHLADLTDKLHADLLRAYCDQALDGEDCPERLEIPLCNPDGEKRWYSLSIRSLPASIGSHDASHAKTSGAICVLRCLEQERALESRLFLSATTDALTGIANRHAFLARVGRLMAQGHRGSLALFEIDSFRAICLRFGQRAGDSVVEAFARFLQTMLDQDNILARLEDNRFAVMLPSSSHRDAIDYASEIVATFAEISKDAELEDMRLTASASVCGLTDCLDDALKRGEVALTIARSAGGFRVECGDAIRQSWRSRKTA